jgi:hypothetical protein
MAKDSQSPYVEGPAENRFWQKIKNRDFQRKEPVRVSSEQAALRNLWALYRTRRR